MLAHVLLPARRRAQLRSTVSGILRTPRRSNPPLAFAVHVPLPAHRCRPMRATLSMELPFPWRVFDRSENQWMMAKTVTRFRRVCGMSRCARRVPTGFPTFGTYGNWTLRELDPTGTGPYGNWTLRELDPTGTGTYGNWTLRKLDPTGTLRTQSDASQTRRKRVTFWPSVHWGFDRSKARYFVLLSCTGQRRTRDRQQKSAPPRRRGTESGIIICICVYSSGPATVYLWCFRRTLLLSRLRFEFKGAGASSTLGGTAGNAGRPRAR
eukprot:gene20698-biopygen22134